jgi:prepilin-type processing-associated H-X9-DG protein
LKDPEWKNSGGVFSYADEDKKGNSALHQWEGQNVMFVDGHVTFEKYPNVGIRNDHIWKCWNACSDVTDRDKQGGGIAPATDAPSTNGDSAYYPKNVEDAVLIIEKNGL